MITNVSLVGVWVTDIDAAKDFYVDKLGFREHTDVTMGDFRWCTVNHPQQPDVQLQLGVPVRRSTTRTRSTSAAALARAR